MIIVLLLFILVVLSALILIELRLSHAELTEIRTILQEEKPWSTL